jgi:FkbM family methyltransferase
MPPKSRIRHVAKTVLGRALPASGYRWVLAASVVRDLRSGALAEAELDLVPAAVHPGETVLDVGANHGMWTRVLAEATGPDGRVVAFEPVAFTADTLAAVVRLLGLRNVTIVRKGCGERSERVSFSIPVQRSGVTDAALAHLASREGDAGGPRRRIDAELVALDEMREDFGEVSLLKLDIEGAEPFALRGAERLLSRDAPTVISEVDPELLAGFDTEPGEVIAFLSRLGYRAYAYCERRLEPLKGLPEAGNLVFLHPRREDRLAGFRGAD